MDGLRDCDEVQGAMPSLLSVAKRMRSPTSNTISPLVFSGERPASPLQLCASHDNLPVLDIGIQAATVCLAEVQSRQTEDPFSVQTTDLEINAECINSPILHPCSPPTIQASAFAIGSGDQASGQPIWNAEEALEQLDDTTINSLFDAYRQPYPLSTAKSIALVTEQKSERMLNDLDDKDLQDGSKSK